MPRVYKKPRDYVVKSQKNEKKRLVNRNKL